MNCFLSEFWSHNEHGIDASHLRFYFMSQKSLDLILAPLWMWSRVRARQNVLERRRGSRIRNNRLSSVSCPFSSPKSRNSLLNIAWHFCMTGILKMRKCIVKPIYSGREFYAIYIQSHSCHTEIGLSNECFIFLGSKKDNLPGNTHYVISFHVPNRYHAWNLHSPCEGDMRFCLIISITYGVQYVGVKIGHVYIFGFSLFFP